MVSQSAVQTEEEQGWQKAALKVVHCREEYKQDHELGQKTWLSESELVAV